MIQAMTPDKLLPFINEHVPEGNKVVLGEVLAVHLATNPKTSASHKETKLEPRTQLDEVYDNKANMENPVGVSIRVLQAVVARMWQETGVRPFELAAAIDGGRELHKTHDSLLAQLVAKNFTATAVTSALQSARMTEAWTSNGVDHLVEVTLFVCNYPLRAVIHYLRKAGTVETYTTKDPNVMYAQSREYDILIKAFSPYREYLSYFTGLEGLARNNSGLRKKISEILKEAHLHSVPEIHEKVMVEYRGLDPTSADGTDGDVFMAENKNSVLRVDSAADATIVQPGVIRQPNLKKEEKTWNGAGRSVFKTSHSGAVNGKVSWDKREQGGEKETGSVSFEVDAHVSEICKQNLLSLESLFNSEEWQYVTFQLSEEGRSYLYGSNGKRVPLDRIPGKKGWWLKVRHSDCKLQICSQVYGLIRILGNPTKRIGPLNERTSEVLYAVKHDRNINLKPFSPHDRSTHLLPHELDIYENLPDICSQCTPLTVLGTLQILRQSRQTKPKKNRPEKNRRVFATGIPKELTTEDIREMFGDFGRIESVLYPVVVDGSVVPVAKQDRNAANVLYRQSHEARRAYHLMKGFQMWGTPVITHLDGFTETEPGSINAISGDKIERTVTAKAMHLRLSSTYFERAKKTYEKSDKITLTDVGEVFQLHEIYNHRSLYVLRQMFRIELPTKYTGFACDACDTGKMSRTNAHKTYSKGGKVGRDLKPGEEWHMDLMFFPQEYSYRKGRIVSTRVDGESRASDLAIIRSKVQTLHTLQLFISRSATGKPSRIRVDRGWEYLNAEFKNYCTEQEIELKPSAAYQHGQMGIAERFNRTLKEHVLSSLTARNTDMKWWPEAVHHENYVYNRVAHSAIGYGLPVERESGKLIDTWNIKGVFGCSVKVKKNPDGKPRALEPHFRPGKFLGIAPHSSMGTYRVLMLDTNKIVYSTHVTFDNLVTPSLTEPGVRVETIPDWHTPLESELDDENSKDASEADTEANTQEATAVDADEDHEEYADITELEEPTTPATEAVGGRRLRDRSTIARPNYFIEQATDIYNAPQLAQKAGGDVLKVSWSHPLVSNPIPPLAQRPVEVEKRITPVASRSRLIYGRQATERTDGDVMLVESVPMEVIAREQTGRDMKKSIQAMGDDDDRKRRITELREQAQRNVAEEKELGQPPESYKTLSDALSETNPYRDRIKAAMELEILTLYTMGTFELRPDREYSKEQRQQKRVGTKWVITVKEKLFKARLVGLSATVQIPSTNKSCRLTEEQTRTHLNVAYPNKPIKPVLPPVSSSVPSQRKPDVESSAGQRHVRSITENGANQSHDVRIEDVLHDGPAISHLFTDVGESADTCDSCRNPAAKLSNIDNVYKNEDKEQEWMVDMGSGVPYSLEELGDIGNRRWKLLASVHALPDCVCHLQFLCKNKPGNEKKCAETCWNLQHITGDHAFTHTRGPQLEDVIEAVKCAPLEFRNWQPQRKLKKQRGVVKFFTMKSQGKGTSSEADLPWGFITPLETKHKGTKADVHFTLFALQNIPHQAVKKDLVVEYTVIPGTNSARSVNAVTYDTRRATTDSGAWLHATPHQKDLINFRYLTTPIPVGTAKDNAIIFLTGIGDLCVRRGKEVTVMKHVFYGPEVSSTLLSVKLLTKGGGWTMYVDDKETTLTNQKTGQRINLDDNFQFSYTPETLAAIPYKPGPPMTDEEVAGLPGMKFLQQGENVTEINLLRDNARTVKKGVENCGDTLVGYMNGGLMEFRPMELRDETSLCKWHRRLGHINVNYVKKFAVQNDIALSGKLGPMSCETCALSKIISTISRTPRERATRFLDRVHVDLIGPFTPISRDGYKYAVVMVDCHSRGPYIYYQKTKQADETHKSFEAFCTETGGSPKEVHADGGKEFQGVCKTWCDEKRIKISLSPPYAHHLNGVVERKIRTLKEMTRCMLNYAQLPPVFWTDAMRASQYTRVYAG